METVMNMLLAVCKWACFSASTTSRADALWVQLVFKARWYLPFFWIWSLAVLPVFLLRGGLAYWLLNVRLAFTGFATPHQRVDSAFAPGAHAWRKQLIEWYLIYQN